MVNPSLVASVMASLEVSPGRPSDLSVILSSPDLRDALRKGEQATPPHDLVDYLRVAIPQSRRETWQRLITDLIASGTSPVLYGDPDYPPSLSECWDAPPVLFMRGQLAPTSTVSVAVAGSRCAGEDILRITHTLAAALVHAGRSVVSGLASGVDTAAHTGALDAGGHTVAVLGTGINRMYPLVNAPLAQEIARHGALISQFAPDAPRTRSTFLLRNHTIAGLARTSIIMAAAERSGSRYEAETAAGYGRRVLLWRPMLADQPWAQAMVERETAHFIESADEAVHHA